MLSPNDERTPLIHESAVEKRSGGFDSTVLIGLGLVLLATIINSTNALLFVMTTMNSKWEVMFARMLVLGCTLFMFNWYRYGLIGQWQEAYSALRTKSGLLLFFGWSTLATCYMLALDYTTPVTINLIFTFHTSLVGGIKHFLFKEYLDWVQWMCIFVGSVGLVFIVFGDVVASTIGIVFSVLLTFGMVGFWAGAHLGEDRDAFIVIMPGAFCISGLAASVILVTGQPMTEFDLSNALWILLAGAWMYPVSWYLYSLAPKYIDVVCASLIAMTELFFAPLWVYLYNGTGAPTLITLAGGAVLVVSQVVYLLRIFWATEKDSNSRKDSWPLGYGSTFSEDGSLSDTSTCDRTVLVDEDSTSEGTILII